MGIPTPIDSVVEEVFEPRFKLWAPSASWQISSDFQGRVGETCAQRHAVSQGVMIETTGCRAPLDNCAGVLPRRQNLESAKYSAT